MKPIALGGHSRPLTRVRHNLHGDLLFSSSKDGSIAVWRSHNGERLGTYVHQQRATVTDIDPNYDTTVLLTSSADSSFRFWDVETGKCIVEHNIGDAPVRFTRFAQGCKEAFYVIDAVFGNPYSVLVIFNVDKAKSNDHDCNRVKISLEGKAKVTAIIWGYLNKTIITGHEDGTICIWDAETMELLKESKVFDLQVTDIQMHTDYGYMVASSKDHTAKIADAKTLEVMKIFKADRPLNSSSISPIRPHVIVGGGQEAVDVTTTRNQGKFRVRFFHVIYEEELGSIEGHFGPVNALHFNPDGKSFASGGEDGYVRINHFDEDYFNFKICGEY